MLRPTYKGKNRDLLQQESDKELEKQRQLTQNDSFFVKQSQTSLVEKSKPLFTPLDRNSNPSQTLIKDHFRPLKLT